MEKPNKSFQDSFPLQLKEKEQTPADSERKKNDKIYRVLELYTRLLNGKAVSKSDAAREFGVSEKSIQRDIKTIRDFTRNQILKDGVENDIIYEDETKSYCMLRTSRMMFTNEEVLAISKILLDSRAFTKDEMMDMLDKLLACCVPPKNQKMVNELIANERYHYIEPRHKKIFLDKMWQIGNAIRETKYIRIEYERAKDHCTVTRKVQPQAIMFSEFYFYLAAHIEHIDKEKEFENADDNYPTIYRIDRIHEVTVLDEHFKIPYRERFEEGEYRKRIQFMYGGRLQKTIFWYRGSSIEAVLDRLPTAKILKEEDGKYLVSAETFGKGIEMWLRSQGEMVEVVKNK